MGLRKTDLSFVYFIRSGPNSPVKIGCSINPDGRAAYMTRSSPYVLEVVARIEGGVRLEQRFHALFRDIHSHNEWFHPSGRIDSVIVAINAGWFDPETLPAPQRLYGGPWPDERLRARRAA